MQTRSSSKRMTRRSSRLQGPVTGFKRQALIQLQVPRSKRRKTLSSIVPSHSALSIIVSDSISTSTSSATLSSPINETSLAKEQYDTIAKLNKELEQRTAELQQVLAAASNKEKKAELDQRRSKLRYLEEQFTCALCLEVIAYPILLPHPCGHSFCAICIVKHFFSRFHPPCGTWHEHVECPMCRSVLAYTPQTIPRSPITFPFVRNRAADGAIKSLIEDLAGDKEVKKKSRAKGKSKGQGKLVELEDIDDVLGSWTHGGSARNDWLDRHDKGKTETDYLGRSWTNLNSYDFNCLKERLNV